MSRKVMFVLSFLTIFSLLASGSAYAKKTDPPTWVEVFNPGMADFPDGYLVNAVEVFKNELFAAVYGLGYSGGGQLFRSKDGVNWAPATERGFGLGVEYNESCWNPENMYDTMWDMTVFHNELYILPYDNCGLRPGQILRSADGENWETVTSDAFGAQEAYNVVQAFVYKLAQFQGMLFVNLGYYKAETDETVSEIWRSASGDPDTWEKVMEFPGWASAGSFQVFKGALYIASDGVYEDGNFGAWNPLPEQIWRTFDGVTWEMVVADGFGNPGTDGLGGFADYKGFLYVGVGTYEGNGGQIWRSPDGLAWEPVELTGFGNPLNEKIDGLFTYQGKLYAYTLNWTEGCYVYSSKDGKNWTVANEPGWGNPSYWTSHLTADQAVFKGDLYMGVFGWLGGVMKLVK
jgi:hypothetical protein